MSTTAKLTLMTAWLFAACAAIAAEPAKGEGVVASVESGASSVATKTGRSIKHGVTRAGAAVERGAEKTGAAIKRGAQKTGEGIEHGAEKTGEGVRKGVQKTGAAIKRGGEKIEEKASPASSAS